MLRSRLIPCLLVHRKGLVKTTQFKDPKYVGDPINAVKIFNEKEVDELIVLDIDATVEGRGPNFELIERLANECRMPFCYGGGVTTVEEAQRIVMLGAEKVALSSAAINDPNFISKVGKVIGFQSVVVILDYKRRKFSKSLELLTHNGKARARVSMLEFVSELEEIGVGEIVINSIDRDGKMDGYDLLTAEKVRESFQGPMTVLGGAGSFEDIKKLTKKFKIIGAAAGSFFVFKGKYKAVLISYPSFEDRRQL